MSSRRLRGRSARTPLLHWLHRSASLTNGFPLTLGAFFLGRLCLAPAHFSGVPAVKTSHRDLSFVAAIWPELVRGRRRRLSPTRCIVKHMLAIPNLEPITTINSFDIKNVLCGQPKYSPNGRRYIFVHAIRKLDNDDGSLSRRPHQATTDGSRSASKFPKYNLHSLYPSSRAQGLHLTLNLRVPQIFATFPNTVQARVWFMREFASLTIRHDCQVTRVNSRSYA